MKISFNPSNSNKNILDLIKSNKDIIFDLKGHNIFARGVEFKGTDTNTWRPVVDNLTSNSTTSSLSANQGRVLKALIDGKSDSGHNHDGRYVKKTGDTMSGALNFANGTWNLVGDNSYMGDCNRAGHFGIKAANTTYPGIAFYNNANAHLGNLTAYSGNIRYGVYSLQFLDNGNTSVGASTWTNPFSAYDKDAVKDGQAICVWGQSSHLSNLSIDSGGMSLWLKRVNANAATLNMVLDGEYYANGNQRLAHVSEIPSSLKNPHALTISLNGTSQGPYDGSAAKSINITPGSIGAATSGHNHDGRYVRKWNGVYGSANKFLKLVKSIEEGWIRLEVSDSNNASQGNYGIYLIGWGYDTDNLNVRCLYANKVQYVTALKVVRTSKNNYDFYFQFASGSSYPSYTINYGNSISSIDYATTAIDTIPTATWTSSLATLQLNASQVDWSGIQNKPSTFNPAAHTHTVFKNNLMIKGTNGVSDSASIHLGIGDSDTGFKWISDGKCQIYANNTAVGEWTSGGMNWLRNPTVNGNKVWNAGNDGSGSGLDADLLDGYHASYSSSTPWGTIPVITTQGFMDIGKHLEFHYDNTTGSDYSTLLTCTGNYKNIVNLPSESGTLALLSQVVSTSDFNWTNLPGKVVAGKEFNIVNAGYNNTLAINYLPIDNRNGSATITQYNIYNGNRGLASVYAYRFKADGKSCMWKDARNYAPFYATFNGGFEPILDIKTKSGDWSLGSFSNWGNHLIFAFTSDSDFNAGVNGTAQYYLTAQGEFKINTLRLAGAVSGNMGVNSTNPQIIFAEGSATQQVAITYTDWDTYRPSKGLKVHSYDGSDDANVWFEVQGYNYSSGYVKNGSSNSYVLLGGGGHKPLSEFSLNSSDYDNRYLKLTGGTMTGVIRFNNLISSNSALVLDYKYSAGGFARDIVSMKNSVYGDADLGALSILCYPNSTSNGFQYIYLGTDKYDGPNNLRIYKDKVTFGNNILIDAGNIGSQTVDKSYHLRVNHSVSANSTWSTWYWMGQSGQPTWLWGCNDGGNMYVWNPSNFSVKYATSAGYVSNSLNIFGVSYNGSAAKTVYTTDFIKQLSEGTSTVTDGTMFITSWASDSGFADTNAVNVPYKRKASCLWSYIDSKVSSKYLPLAGGTMNGNARIGHGSGNLYIGNSGNDGWIYTQDIASQSGNDKWAIRTSGAAHFGNVYICTKSDYTTYDPSIIECYTGNNLYLNYYSPRGVNLCNGGGTVQIGPYTTGDTGNNKLFVNGSEFIDGASNVRDHVFANGFRHRSHNSNDSVLLAGGGYSVGCIIKYWAIYSIYLRPTTVNLSKMGGNHSFISTMSLEKTSSAILEIKYPSGFSESSTMIFGNGDHQGYYYDAPVYITISKNYGNNDKLRITLANDTSLDEGEAYLYFLCMG